MGNLLNAGIINESSSALNTRLRIVSKKNGKLRMCLDYRPLNMVTKKDRFIFRRSTKLSILTKEPRISAHLMQLLGTTDSDGRKFKQSTAFSWKRGIMSLTEGHLVFATNL